MNDEHFKGLDIEPMTTAAAEALGPQLARIDPWARYNNTPTALTTFLAGHEPGASRFAITADRAIVGATSIRSNWLLEPYLQFLAILPDYQDRGFGGIVLAWFEREARRTGARNLWVAASEFNPRALSFYEHHGFERAARLPDLIADGHTEILLRKRLMPS